jgi:hypothetical protein
VSQSRWLMISTNVGIATIKVATQISDSMNHKVSRFMALDRASGAGHLLIYINKQNRKSRGGPSLTRSLWGFSGRQEIQEDRRLTSTIFTLW